MDPETPANGSMDAQVAQELAQGWPVDLPPTQVEQPEITSPEAAAEGTTQQASDPDEEFLKASPMDSPEIAEFKKSLQRGYSRKMNKIAEQLKQLEQKGTSNGEEARKAQAFELLMNSDDPVAAVAAIKKLQGNPQAQTQNAIGSIVKSVPKEIAEKYQPEHLNLLTGLMMHVIEQGLVPQLRPYQQYLDRMVQTQASSEWDNLGKKFPTATKYREQAERIAREKGLSAEDALLVASRGQVLLEQQRHAQTQKIANGVPTQVSATTPRQTVPISNGNAINDDDIAAELFEIDKREGTKRYFANRFFKG